MYTAKQKLLLSWLTIIYIAMPGILISGNTDSLYKILPSADQQQKIEIYQQLCREYLFDSPDSCLKYGKKVIDMAKQNNNYDALTQVNKKIGYLYFRLSEYDSSLKYLSLAKEYSISCADSLNLAIIVNMIGNTYIQISDYTSSLEHLLHAEKICEELDINPKTQTRIKRLYSIINTNLGLLYYNLDSIRKAESFFNQALGYALEIKDSTRISAAYTNLGMVYRSQKELNKALNMYHKSLIISENIGNEGYQEATLNNIANLYLDLGQPDSALFYFKTAKTYAHKKGDKYGLSLINNNIANVYLSINSYDSALFYARSAINYSDSILSLTEKYKNHKLISEIFSNKNWYDSAHFHLDMYSKLKDSAMSKERRIEVAEIHTKYQTEKKEEENKWLKKDIETERNRSHYLILLSLILLLLGIISITLFYFIRKNTITKRKLAESEAARLESEIEAQKRELALGALSLSRNIEFTNSLIIDLKNLSDHTDEQGVRHLNNIVKKLSSTHTDTSWKEFEKRFADIHSNFYNRLLKDYPDLSQNEVKLCAFLKMGMNTKEICAITFQNVRAVEAARLRLRKKLKLNKGDNLSMFLQGF